MSKLAASCWGSMLKFARSSKRGSTLPCTEARPDTQPAIHRGPARHTACVLGLLIFKAARCPKQSNTPSLTCSNPGVRFVVPLLPKGRKCTFCKADGQQAGRPRVMIRSRACGAARCALAHCNDNRKDGNFGCMLSPFDLS